MGRLLLIFLFSFFLFSKPSLARNLGSATGEISGIIKDSSKNEPLLGVNIILSGTGIGTISDIDGKFLIESVPAGTAKIVITFIGFKTKEYTVEMKEGEKIFLEVKLTPDLLKMGEGVSTQNRGQQAAINTQLNSDALVNAVSSVRIKELPDVDAAEAVGHLSGVSIERESGEASKILLRGLDPKFTNITINGVKVPASSETDRSVDLRIISPELLSGIEVYKSPTADMDGDALAGSVNLLVNKALDKPSANIRIFGGYNDLGDKYGNFKSSAFYSHRFWKKN